MNGATHKLVMRRQTRQPSRFRYPSWNSCLTPNMPSTFATYRHGWIGSGRASRISCQLRPWAVRSRVKNFASVVANIPGSESSSLVDLRQAFIRGQRKPKQLKTPFFTQEKIFMNQRPPTVRILATAELPTRWGYAQAQVFGIQEHSDGEIITLTHRASQAQPEPIPLVRLHSACLTSEVLGAMNCDCAEQLAKSLEQIMSSNYGILIYVTNHEGRGIGLAKKIQAYALQATGINTVDANLALKLPVDARDYRPCAQVLQILGASRIRLLTNNPDKLQAMLDAGIDVVERVALDGFENPHNRAYLTAKQQVLGHLLQLLLGAM
jgi:GTP cyclohydrolase II